MPEEVAPGPSGVPGRVWSNPNFRRLWAGSAASTFGSEVAELALPLLAIITLSASATAVGLLRVAQFLPFLLVTLPIGMLVDRHRAHRLSFMVGADLGRFLLVGTIPLAVWAGVGRMELVYVAVFATGVLTVLYQLSDFALLPSIVAPEQLVDANGRITGTQAANEVGGRGLGGLLIEATSAPAAVAVNAVTFLVSALSLRRIRLDDDGGALSSPAARFSWHDTVEGLRMVLRHRYLRPLLGEASTYNIFNEMFVLGLMLYAVRGLGMNAAELGLVFTASGVGAFVGSWFGPRITGRWGYGRVLLATVALGNTMPLACAFAGGFGGALLPVLCAVFVAMGLGSGIANVHGVTLRQVAVPDELHGRVNAAYRLLSWGGLPLGAAVGGIVAARWGALSATAVGAAGMAASTLWILFSAVPRLRRIADARWDSPANGMTGSPENPSPRAFTD